MSIHRTFNSTDDSALMIGIETDEFRPPRSPHNGECVDAVYEGKMFHQFDHRFGTYIGQTAAQERQGKLPELTPAHHANPYLYSQPRVWIHSDQTEGRLSPHENKRQWLVAFRDIASPVVFRTAIAAVLPRVPTVDFRLIFFPESERPADIAAFLGAFNSFVFDYLARQKFSGNHLSTFVVRQLPMPGHNDFALNCSLRVDDLLDRVLELSYTAWDLESFGMDCGCDGPPFVWDEERRFLIRCELDAAYFQIYGIERDDVDYIMDTFPIVRRNDEDRYGEFRTKRVILEMYDQMAEASRTSQPYQTWLDPPPADPRVAHPPRTQRLAYGEVVADILLLLREWNSAASILALEPAVLLMQNEQARNAFLGRVKTTGARSQGQPPFKIVEGIDLVYQGLLVNGAIEPVGQNGYRLLKPELIADLSAENRQRARQVVAAIQKLDRPEDALAIVAEVTNERYAVAVF